MQMKKLIINADDFGISKETNLAIKQGFEAEIISSTSLIVNLEAFEHAIFEILPTIPNIDMGFHFNIIEGKSLTNQPLLCDKNGFFNNSYGQLIIKSFNKELIKYGSIIKIPIAIIIDIATVIPIINFSPKPPITFSKKWSTLVGSSSSS